ncbi:MAG: hypothetical protein LBK99_08275 [Opitutaceae bacterium]|jgi:hypothetical protein|nr:hypothetical protein [Opitutaceae bacterium]
MNTIRSRKAHLCLTLLIATLCASAPAAAQALVWTTVFDGETASLANWTASIADLPADKLSADAADGIKMGNSSTNNPNFTLSSNQTFSATNAQGETLSWRITLTDFAFATRINQAMEGFLIGFGPSLRLQLTTTGHLATDRGRVYFNQNTLHNLDYGPNFLTPVSLRIEYDAATRRLLITQLAGNYSTDATPVPEDGLVIFDKVMSASLVMNEVAFQMTGSGNGKGGFSSSIKGIKIETGLVAVPEPAAAALLVAALAAFAFAFRLRRPL